MNIQLISEALALWVIDQLSSEELILLCERLVAEGESKKQLVELAGLSRKTSLDLESVMPDLASEFALEIPSMDEAVLTVGRATGCRWRDGKIDTAECLGILASLWSKDQLPELTQFVVYLDDLETANATEKDEILQDASEAINTLISN